MKTSLDPGVSNIIIDLSIRVVIFSLHGQHLSVLLNPLDIQNRPHTWEIPGCPLDAQETLEGTVSCCLTTYIGTHEAYVEQLYTYGDESSPSNRRVVTVVYFSLIPSDAFIAESSRGDQAAWFNVENLPTLIVEHMDIIEYALRRLRYKLEYSAVGFELLPEFFTLSELQQTYEIVLGEKLDKRNFRRRILDAHIIEATEHYRTGEGRPARLYRYRPDAVAEVKARRLFP